MTTFSSSLCQSQADIQITMVLAHALLLSINNTLRIEKAINVPLQNNLPWLTAQQICNKEVSAAAKHLLLASTPSKTRVHLLGGSGQHGDLRSKLLGTWAHCQAPQKQPCENKWQRRCFYSELLLLLLRLCQALSCSTQHDHAGYIVHVGSLCHSHTSPAPEHHTSTDHTSNTTPDNQSVSTELIERQVLASPPSQ